MTRPTESGSSSTPYAKGSMSSLSDTTAPHGTLEALNRPPIWAWPLAVLVGFPIGGLIANVVVGPINSIAAALAGGLIAGAVVGAAQWLALRQLVPWIWIVATSIGMAVGLALGAALVDYGVSRADLVLMGAVTGLGVGALQALVLARQGIRGSAWWAVATPLAWALAWFVASYVLSSNVDEQFTNFGASGALLYGLLTSLVLALLLRRTESRGRKT